MAGFTLLGELLAFVIVPQRLCIKSLFLSFVPSSVNCWFSQQFPQKKKKMYLSPKDGNLLEAGKA